VGKLISIFDYEVLRQREAYFGQFSRDLKSLLVAGPRAFRIAQDVCEHTLFWGWISVLAGEPLQNVRERFRQTVDQCMVLRNSESGKEWKAEHDVFVAHLALLAMPAAVLESMAEVMTSANQRDKYDQAQAAWSGVLKYSIQKTLKKAAAQAELLYGACKPINLRLPRRSVVQAWLAQDAKQLNAAMLSGYRAGWARLSRDGHIISEASNEIKIALRKLNFRTDSLFPEIAFGLLASRIGLEVPDDELWFPVGLRGLAGLDS
jgi:hypothetical protein